MGKRILITGASGFIGSYLVKDLNDQELDFLAIDAKRIPGLSEDRQREVSLLEKGKLDNIIKEYQPNVVIHLAAVASVTHENVGEIYNVNVCGTANLLEAIKKNCPSKTRVILVSTAGVYGNQDVELYEENLPFNPANHYSYSIMVTEYLSRQYRDDMEIIIVRPFNIIGAGQRDIFLIPKLVKCFADKKEVIQVGNIKSYRDYVDVQYCGEILKELILRNKVDFDILNICSGIPCSGEMVIDMLKDITGFSPKVEISNEFVRQNEVWKMIGNPQRLLRFMNGRKGKDLRSILVDMLEYYKV